MSTLQVDKIMETFPVRKVVRAFRTTGAMNWDIGRVMGYEKHSKTGEPLGMIVQFFSDGGIIDYPFAVLNLGDDSFVVDVPKEDVIRELWPIDSMVMVHLGGHPWMVAHVGRHTEYGISLDTNIGSTTFTWSDFTDDGQCAELKHFGKRHK